MNKIPSHTIALWSPFSFESCRLYSRYFMEVLQALPCSAALFDAQCGSCADSLRRLRQCDLILVLLDANRMHQAAYYLYPPFHQKPAVPIICDYWPGLGYSRAELAQYFRADSKRIIYISSHHSQASDDELCLLPPGNTTPEHARFIIRKAIEELPLK